MKIALLFAGRIKAFEFCLASFKKFILEPLRDHEVDAYVSLNSKNENKNLEFFVQHYNVKKFEIIDVPENIQDNFPIPMHHIFVALPISYTMYFCWQKVFQLMESSTIDYDLVIYLRADQKFSNSLILPRIIEDNTLYVPVDHDYEGLNDQFAMGKMNVMRHYMNLYSYVNEIYKTTNIPFHTETYVKIHNSRVFNIIRFPLFYTLHPLRK